VTRKEYVEQVLSALNHTTTKEKREIRAEIDAHIEDHICDLMGLGYSEKLAEERTMLRMGDPEEVGRELNKQYPMRWLLIRWIAMVLAVIVLLTLAGPLQKRLRSSMDSLWGRWQPERVADLTEMGDADGPLVTAVWDPGVEIHVEDVHIRVYQAGVDDPVNGGEAWLAVSWWRDNPFFPQPDTGKMEFYINGELAQWGAFWFSDCIRGIPVTVEPGDDIELSMKIYGTKYTRTVELPWEEAAT